MNSVRVFSSDIMPLVKELLNNNQEVLLTVSGTSMRPFFKHQKTVVKLGKIDTDLKKYDVVIYQHLGVYKLHRLLKIKDDICLINGDALREIERVDSHELFGYVIAHQHQSKWIDHRSFPYLIKVRLWSLLRPFRFIMLRIFRG